MLIQVLADRPARDMSVCGPLRYKYLANTSVNFPSNYRPADWQGRSEVADSRLLPIFRRRFGTLAGGPGREPCAAAPYLL